MIKQNGIIIGLLAGIAAGLMMLAAMRAGPAMIIMLFAAPAAIYMASLGWGTVAGIGAATTACVIAFFAGGPAAAVFSLVLLFGPAAWTGHLANLGQPSADGKSTIWFPIDMIFLRLVVMIAIGFVVLGLIFGYDSATIEEGMLELLREFVGSQSDANLTDEGLQRSARLYAAMVPVILPAMWVFLHVTVFYVSAAIVRQSGKLARAKDDIPATANLPFAFVGLPLAGIVGMYVAGSPIYEIAAVMTGAGLAAFSLTGLAELHLTSRGKPSRPALLFAVYAFIFAFTLPLLFFAALGVLRSWRMRPPPSPTNPPSNPPAVPPRPGANDNE